METCGISSKLIELTPTQYAALINGLVRKCESWLRGEMPGDRLVAMFKSVSRQTWVVRGMHGHPDDFDWKSITNEAREAELLDDRFHEAYRLLKVAEKTVDTLAQAGPETEIKRAYFFGIHCRRLALNPLIYDCD